MGFSNVFSSLRGDLSGRQILELANLHLENARKTNDDKIASVLCEDVESALSHVKKAAKSAPKDADHQDLEIRVATAYSELGKLQGQLGLSDKAEASIKKAEKWGLTQVGDPNNQGKLTAAAKIPQRIFENNIRPPTTPFEPPEADKRLNNTLQLTCCLILLKGTHSPENVLDPEARDWLQTTKNDREEQSRLEMLARDVVRAFKRDELKDAMVIAEVVYLAPVLKKDDFRHLLIELYSGISQSELLEVHQLGGLAQLIQSADRGYLNADDLVKILILLNKRLKDTHQQAQEYIYQLTLTVAYVLDAMADTEVKGLDREMLHEPLTSYLDGLKSNSDPYMVYQASYAHQALLYVPDDETPWQKRLRLTGSVIQGVSGLVSAVTGMDFNGFIDGLKDIQKGLPGVIEVAQQLKTAYDGANSLADAGKNFLDSLREAFSFDRKCAWYPALRGADVLIQEGQLADFRKLVCELPCLQDPAFQWGVCQRLGDVASNTLWDMETRKSAVAFLGEIYKNDTEWGKHASVKQWILNILMRLSSPPPPESVLQCM
ncbi:hypothetical protein BGZ65_000498 [Modicella reniformis]|uniref:Arm-like repeat domain-containing protein n=1 Tax=Modicella reniformis TaxID=1440133 RepID=A0A9P6MAB3_9FUNG|nr:hypothetical protein BGZ65_000498 [Modicella reniformis]